MTRPRRPLVGRGAAALAVLLCWAAALVLTAAPTSVADTYTAISGSGSTWSQNALDSWRRNVNQYGMVVNYAGTGSSIGRQQFAQGAVDFAVSEIPYGLQDGQSRDPLPTQPFAYMPIVAGGTSFMYNLVIGGRQVTSLRLSGPTLAGIFAGEISRWDDAAIKADNPGLVLPARRIVPVVRSDGSGTSAQFTAWMISQQGSVYQKLCAKAGRSPCTQTSSYPVLPGFVAKYGSDGVAGFVSQAQNQGSITYVEYSYAMNAGFPVAKVLNRAGYYTQPTARAVAVGLLGARINMDKSNSATYLTQDLSGVYTNADARAYPLSSYSYMVVPTSVTGRFTEDKGKTLSSFAYYFLCEGQQSAEVLGYSPLPINLVQAGFEQVKRIPGAAAKSISISGCRNPTFSTDGTNTLAKTAPMPAACDKQGTSQCGTSATGAGTAPSSSGGPKTSPNPAAGPGTVGSPGAGTRNPAAGTVPGTRTGVSGGPRVVTPGSTGPAPVSGPARGAVDPTAVDPAGADPAGVGGTDTGVLAAGPGAVSVPLTLADNQGWRPDHTVALLAAVSMLLLVLGPPLLIRRMGERR